MNGPSFRLALRQTIRIAVIVAIGYGLFEWVIMVSSAGFAKGAPPFLLDPPRAIRALVGGNFNFLAPSGWLATGMYHPVVLSLQTLGAYMVATGSGASELERGTLDLVLARPVSRRSYIAARAAASLVVLTIVELGGLAGALISRQTVGGADALPVGDIVLVFVDAWLLFAAFGFIALAVFAASRLRSRAMGAAIFIVIGSFFVNFVSLLFDGLSWMRFLTPFNYFRAGNILNGEPYAGSIVVLVLLTIVAATVGVITFSRRDLTR